MDKLSCKASNCILSFTANWTDLEQFFFILESGTHTLVKLFLGQDGSLSFLLPLGYFFVLIALGEFSGLSFPQEHYVSQHFPHDGHYRQLMFLYLPWLPQCLFISCWQIISVLCSWVVSQTLANSVACTVITIYSLFCCRFKCSHFIVW